MYNRPMSSLRSVQRLAAPRLREALADSPVVAAHGPRQRGKTTLAQMTCAPSDHRCTTPLRSKRERQRQRRIQLMPSIQSLRSMPA